MRNKGNGFGRKLNNTDFVNGEKLNDYEREILSKISYDGFTTQQLYNLLSDTSFKNKR